MTTYRMAASALILSIAALGLSGWVAVRPAPDSASAEAAIDDVLSQIDELRATIDDTANAPTAEPIDVSGLQSRIDDLERQVGDVGSELDRVSSVADAACNAIGELASQGSSVPPPPGSC